MVRNLEGPDPELRRLFLDEGSEDCGELHKRVLSLVQQVEESYDPWETSGRRRPRIQMMDGNLNLTALIP